MPDGIFAGIQSGLRRENAGQPGQKTASFLPPEMLHSRYEYNYIFPRKLGGGSPRLGMIEDSGERARGSLRA